MSDAVSDEFRQAVAEMTGVPRQWCSATHRTRFGSPRRPPSSGSKRANRPAGDRGGAGIDGHQRRPHRNTPPGHLTTQDELRRLSQAERMRAWREGRLMHLGRPPQPRRIGLTGAPTTQA